MDEDRLKTILKARVQDSLGFIGGELSDQRASALDLYYGEPFGDEQDGRSQVVLTDVADTIETILPQLIKVYLAGDEVVKFEPQGPEDEQTADQATEYVNYIFRKDNPGFLILYSWFKDALLQKNGFVKVSWVETEEPTTSKYTGLTEDELALLLQDDTAKVVEQSEYTGEIPLVDGSSLPVPMFDVTLTMARKKGRVAIETVPPEEILVSRRAVSHQDPEFIAHRRPVTRSELIEMGYDKKKVMDLQPTMGGDVYREETTARHDVDDERAETAQSIIDEAMQEIMIVEAYIKVDYDGDGRAEWRKVTVASENSYDILDNEAIDEPPFETITPVIMPHKYFGRSVVDQIGDMQKIRSTVMRQLLDNMYGCNNNRTAVDDSRVELDDLLTNRVDGIVRTDGPPGDSILPMPNTPLGPFAYPLLEYTDQIKESRTGVTRYTAGLDPDALNKTATGINILTQQSNQRIELIARTFAETGVSRLFRKILRLVIRHQDEARMIRLRNEFVQFDPREWNADMDVTVEVGLGYGSQEAQAGMAVAVLNEQKALVEMQGGFGGMVSQGNMYAAYGKLVEATGEQSVEPYFTDPDSPQAQQVPPKQDPKMVEAQNKAQIAQAEFQADQQRAQADMALEREKMAQEMQLAREEMASKLAMQREEMQARLAMEREKMMGQMELQRVEAGMRAVERQEAT